MKDRTAISDTSLVEDASGAGRKTARAPTQVLPGRWGARRWLDQKTDRHTGRTDGSFELGAGSTIAAGSLY
jgi:hypothetical protein